MERIVLFLWDGEGGSCGDVEVGRALDCLDFFEPVADLANFLRARSTSCLAVAFRPALATTMMVVFTILKVLIVIFLGTRDRTLCLTQHVCYTHPTASTVQR